jgi:hypothetical protein
MTPAILNHLGKFIWAGSEWVLSSMKARWESTEGSRLLKLRLSNLTMKNSFSSRCKKLKMLKSTKTVLKWTVSNRNSSNLHASILTNSVSIFRKLLRSMRGEQVPLLPIKAKWTQPISQQMRKKLKRCGANWCTVCVAAPLQKWSKSSTLYSASWQLSSIWTNPSTNSLSSKSLNLNPFFQKSKKDLRQFTIQC